MAKPKKPLTDEQRAAAKERARIWREENRERYQEIQRDSYARRREDILADRASPEYREQKKVYDAQYRSANREQIAIRNKQYYEDNQEAVKAGNRRRQAEFRARRAAKRGDE